MGGIAVMRENPKRSTSRGGGLRTQVLRVKIGQSLDFADIGVSSRRRERNLTLKYVYGLSQRLAAVSFRPQKMATAPFFTSLRARSSATDWPSERSGNTRSFLSLGLR